MRLAVPNGFHTSVGKNFSGLRSANSNYGVGQVRQKALLFAELARVTRHIKRVLVYKTRYLGGLLYFLSDCNRNICIYVLYLRYSPPQIFILPPMNYHLSDRSLGAA